MPWMLKIGQVLVGMWICSKSNLRLGPYPEMAENDSAQPKRSFHRDTGGLHKQEST